MFVLVNYVYGFWAVLVVRLGISHACGWLRMMMNIIVALSQVPEARAYIWIKAAS